MSIKIEKKDRLLLHYEAIRRLWRKRRWRMETQIKSKKPIAVDKVKYDVIDSYGRLMDVVGLRVTGIMN